MRESADYAGDAVGRSCLFRHAPLGRPAEIDGDFAVRSFLPLSGGPRWPAQISREFASGSSLPGRGRSRGPKRRAGDFVARYGLIQAAPRGGPTTRPATLWPYLVCSAAAFCEGRPGADKNCPLRSELVCVGTLARDEPLEMNRSQVSPLSARQYAVVRPNSRTLSISSASARRPDEPAGDFCGQIP